MSSYDDKLNKISDKFDTEMSNEISNNRDILTDYLGDLDAYMNKYKNEMTLSQKYIYLKLIRGYIKYKSQYVEDTDKRVVSQHM